MAKLSIDIKQKDLPRIRELLSADVKAGIITKDISTDDGVLSAFEEMIKLRIIQTIQSFEIEKKRQEFVPTVQAVDLS